MNNSNTISSFDKFALDPSTWLYFGETQWDEAILQPTSRSGKAGTSGENH
jgi:hypothetical protein